MQAHRKDTSKNDFSLIAESFLKEPGLPLAGVLDGESIERVFREEDALFGQDDIYSTPVVLWAFLAQMLREVRFDVKVPGYRTGSLTIVTTLTDPKTYSREDLAELYGFRWNAELNIRQIQQTLPLDHIRCKTPPRVRRELWGTLLAYNRIRQILATAASVRRKQPRQLGFTLACQALLASWLLLATGSLPRSARVVHDAPGPSCRKRGRQPTRSHRAAGPQTPSPSLPPHAATARATP